VDGQTVTRPPNEHATPVVQGLCFNFGQLLVNALFQGFVRLQYSRSTQLVSVLLRLIEFCRGTSAALRLAPCIFPLAPHHALALALAENARPWVAKALDQMPPTVNPDKQTLFNNLFTLRSHKDLEILMLDYCASCRRAVAGREAQ
jgi:hypothetical protein